LSVFFDTNILVYGYDDTPRGMIARGLLAQGGHIAVQSLNELALVLRRRYGLTLVDLRAEVARVAETFADPVPLTLDIHRAGMDLVERHQLQIYDSMLIAAALHAGCTVFHSEDMADGRVIDGRLTIRNPFG
jgi:predicted nucleic acid-binding protein